MLLRSRFRQLLAAAAFATLVTMCAAGGVRAQPMQRGRPGPGQMRVGPRPNQEHLAQWMDRHRTLPLPEQQRALENEPGFRDLSPQVQQRMRDRLTQLNSMPPAQRQHILERAEAMEHLSPQQRQQVRGAMMQLSTLPEDRRRAVARAFHNLRGIPPNQREAALLSDQFRSQFSDEERSTLSSLIAVEPYLPGRPGAPPTPGSEPRPPAANSFQGR